MIDCFIFRPEPYFGRSDYRSVKNFIKYKNLPSNEYMKKNNIKKWPILPKGYYFESPYIALYKISTDTLVKKTEEDLKLERLVKIQIKVLKTYQPIATAIAVQEATNRILREQNKPEIYTISKEEIVKVGKYLNKISTFDKVFEPKKVNMDDINESLFNNNIPFTVPKVFRYFQQEMPWF